MSMSWRESSVFTGSLFKRKRFTEIYMTHCSRRPCMDSLNIKGRYFTYTPRIRHKGLLRQCKRAERGRACNWTVISCSRSYIILSFPSIKCICLRILHAHICWLFLACWMPAMKMEIHRERPSRHFCGLKRQKSHEKVRILLSIL